MLGKQNWKIFNLSKGLVLDKSSSINILLYLLGNKWKSDKIVITGNYDDTYYSSEIMKEYIDIFLFNYKTNFEKIIKNEKNILFNMNLYNLYINNLLPEEVSNININIEYVDTICQFDLELEDKIIKNNYNEDYYVKDENVMIKYEELYVEDSEYVLVNETKSMYVLFDKKLMKHNFLRKKFKMSLIKYNELVIKIVLYLLYSHSGFGRGYNEKFENIDEDYIGLWCGDNIFFEKSSNKIKDYKNISHLFLSFIQTN